MSFTPRSFEQILLDMVNHVRANTTLTDFTVGSVIRTILEAAALEDDEQYFQMVQLLDAFRIANSTGEDLDERAADLNESRLPAKAAFGHVVIKNEAIIQNILSFDAYPADGTITVDDSSSFPVTPPNFNIRVGEGTAQIEDLIVTGNDTATGILTLSVAVVNDHFSGERVSVVSGSDSVLVSGIQVQVPAQGMNLPIKFTTVEPGVTASGNYQSGLIAIKANEVGGQGTISATQISQFVSAAPFTGAGVTNPSDTSDGRDLESDDDFRDRLMYKFAKLSRGVPQAVEKTVIGSEDTNVGQRIVTAKLRENFVSGDHTLFIDDGTGLVPDYVIMGSTTFSAPEVIGQTVLSVTDPANFPSSGLVLLSADVPAVAELAEFTSKGPGNLINLATPLVNNHAATEEILLVEDLGIAEDGQNFFRLTNYPVRRNSYEIYDNSSGEYVKRSDIDLFVNRTNGDVEYAGSGLWAGARVVANYSYYTGIVQLAQKVLNGDPDDRVNYPGVVAGGVIISVDVPTLRRISVILSISVENGYDEATVTQDVIRAVTAYVDALRIGDNVIRAKIIERAMSTAGVTNAIIKVPTDDIVVLEDELPVSFDSNGNTLIMVY